MLGLLSWILRKVGEINDYHFRQLILIREHLGSGPKKTVDVGSHVGGWSIIANLVFPNSRQVLIDPQALVSRLSIRRWLTRRCLFLQVAISSEDGLNFFQMADRKDSASLDPSAGGYSQLVTTRRLDSLIRDGAIDAPEILKIDAEGYDFEALESLGRFTQYLRAVVLEVASQQGKLTDLDRIEQWGSVNDFEVIGVWPGSFLDGRCQKYDLLMIRKSQ